MNAADAEAAWRDSFASGDTSTRLARWRALEAARAQPQAAPEPPQAPEPPPPDPEPPTGQIPPM